MSRRVLLVILYLYAFIFSILKTMRLPNEWSEAHWLMDYKFGFIKRGLAGEIFGWFFEKNEFNILLISIGILFLLYGLIFKIAIKEIFKGNNSFYKILFFLIFFLSGYIIFSAHLIGYFDHIVFLLTILVIFLMKKNKIFLSSLIITFSIFIHEISFFLMLPISCFALIINENGVENFSIKNIFTPHLLNKFALLLVFPVLALITISLYQEMNGKDYYSIIFNYLKDYSFITNDRASSVSFAYTTSFIKYFNNESPHFLQRLFVSKATILFGIPISFSLWMIFKEFKLKQNIQLFLFLGIIAFIPLLLHAIAWDTYRIWSFPFMILFLAFWILSSKFKSDKKEVRNLSTLEIVFFLLAFLLVTLAPNVLFDEQTERFSLISRIVIIIPIFIMLYFIKKPQSKRIEASKNV